jgi:hypothetical protein
MNLQMAEGKVLEDAVSKDAQYVELATQSFKPSQISEDVRPVPVSREEWGKMEKESIQEVHFDENRHYRFRPIHDPKK